METKFPTFRADGYGYVSLENEVKDDAVAICDDKTKEEILANKMDGQVISYSLIEDSTH